MLFAAMLSFCGMMPMVVDDIVRLREEGNVTEAEFREAIKERDEMPAELRTRALGAVTLIYALPKGSNYASTKALIVLTCNSKEIYRGHQHSHERPGRGTGSRSGHEQYRGDGTN